MNSILEWAPVFIPGLMIVTGVVIAALSNKKKIERKEQHEKKYIQRVDSLDQEESDRLFDND